MLIRLEVGLERAMTDTRTHREESERGGREESGKETVRPQSAVGQEKEGEMVSYQRGGKPREDNRGAVGAE